MRVFCDDWEQASHNGDLVHAVDGRRARRGTDVTELGAVLAGDAEGRRSDDEIDGLRLDRPRDSGPRDRARGARARRTSSTCRESSPRRQPTARAGSRMSRIGSRSPSSARATSRPAAKPRTLPWPEYPAATQTRSLPGRLPTSGSRSSVVPQIPAQRCVTSGGGRAGRTRAPRSAPGRRRSRLRRRSTRRSAPASREPPITSRRSGVCCQ